VPADVMPQGEGEEARAGETVVLHQRHCGQRQVNMVTGPEVAGP
jgi:hypothetical protein